MGALISVSIKDSSTLLWDLSRSKLLVVPPMSNKIFFFFPPAGLAVLSHTLTPRMKASHIALQTMRGHLDAVYDVTVAYEGSLDSSRHRKPAPSMPGEHKRTICSSVVKPGLRSVLYFSRGPLSSEAVCHPVLVSLVSSKHFCPFMTPFLLFLSAVSRQCVLQNNLLSWPPRCVVPLFAF